MDIGEICGFLLRKKPYKLEPYFKSWGSDGHSTLLDSTGTLFPEVQWDDEEPTEIEMTIKNK